MDLPAPAVGAEDTDEQKGTTDMTIIGLTGYATVGKDTVGQMLVQRGYTRVSFADQVRDLAYEVNPYIQGPVRTEHGVMVFPGFTRLQVIVDRMGWQQAKMGSPEIRRTLQALGNGARTVLGERVWIDGALRRAAELGDAVITDVRYVNEGAAIQEAGGLIVRITRDGTGPLNDHPSETEVAGVHHDFLINNSSTLDLTERQVEQILGQVAA